MAEWIDDTRSDDDTFSFSIPAIASTVYSPDMPKRLPLKDIISGLVSSLARAIRFWLHYTLVAMAWLGIVPLTACRIYRCLFTGSVSSVLTLPLDVMSS